VSSDETVDPRAKSWVSSTQQEGIEFPIQSLPFGVFSTAEAESPRIGVAIGDQILDLRACADRGLLDGLSSDVLAACRDSTLNALMQLGRAAARETRAAAHRLLRNDTSERVRAGTESALVPMRDAQMHVPARVGDYTDFYASIEHATNVGSLFRPDDPLLPNYKYVPIGYHGRASSVVVSGTPVRRPAGQTKPDGAAAPSYGPSRALDYEAEVGFYVAGGNRLGDPIPLDRAEDHIFGFCLVNDWSARDIQSWEYQPLGPFLAKNFATTVSPWVVTTDALEPFRGPARRRAAGDPKPLPYLDRESDRNRGALSMSVEVWLSTPKIRQSGQPLVRLSSSDFALMYWTPAQMLTHHTSNGCNLLAGDLLASGTVSGPTREERGCLLELARRGADPVRLPNGEQRVFLEDGDEVILRGWCRRKGFVAISLGECRGLIEPSVVTMVS
jgi:fumarylacetoacetase